MLQDSYACINNQYIYSDRIGLSDYQTYWYDSANIPFTNVIHVIKVSLSYQCVRTGRSVGTTWNYKESGRSRVQS